MSPVFDVAMRFLLVDVIGGEASFTRELQVQRADRAAMVVEFGVDVVVCGAISRDLEERLLTNGVEVVAEIRGEVTEVVRACLEGSLGLARFSMPGTRGRRRLPRGHPRRSGIVEVAGAARTAWVGEQ